MKNDRRNNSFCVMHLIATNFLGGPEKQILEHLRRLNSDVFRGLLASFQEGVKKNELLQVARNQGFDTRTVKMCGFFDFRAQFWLNKLLKKEKIDLLVVHGYKSCVMGWWSGKKHRIPVLAYSRGYTSENKKIAFYNWLERLCLKKVYGVIAVSNGQERRLCDYGIKPKNLWVVHNAIDINVHENKSSITTRSKILEILNLPPNAKIIISAGRFSHEKGHKYLIAAIPKIQNKRKNVYYVFCGDGPLAGEIKHDAQKLGVLERCRFPGFRRDLNNFLSAMDIMVLPSLSEGLPNVVLEAFAAGKPVVATHVGGVPEVVEEGVSGFLVPPKRPDLLADAVVKLLSNPERMRAMGQAGYERVKRDFTFEAQTEKLEAIYLQVIGGRNTEKNDGN